MATFMGSAPRPRRGPTTEGAKPIFSGSGGKAKAFRGCCPFHLSRSVMLRYPVRTGRILPQIRSDRSLMRPENTIFRKTSRMHWTGFRVFLTVAAIGVLAAPAAPAAEPAPRLELKPGDHLCLIGNTLAERMQFDGWLETLFQARFPRHELVIRNLGYSGDELTLRLRSEGFGSPDDHLTSHKADVVLAFFGFN